MQDRISRRTMYGRFAAGVAGIGMSRLLGEVAAQAAVDPRRKRSCILLWMAGGPSQIDTFDLKSAHVNGGPFREVQTTVPGIRISEHLPGVARHARRLALVRSMQTREGDHGRATAHLRTGYTPQGSIRFPSIGSLVAHELADAEADLPGYVSVLPQGAFALGSTAAGFLGPRHAPVVVGRSGALLRVDDIAPAPAVARRAADRFQMLQAMEAEFLRSRRGSATASHVSAYDRASRLQRAAAAQAFDLSREPASVHDRYGRSSFAQGCLLARRLVERCVPFVEVTFGGWDTHDNNFEQVRSLCDILDPAWSALMADLEQRGLLDETLLIWMGEFGRTPGINPRTGRDHYPPAWSVVLGGGGIRGGQVVGRTDPAGVTVQDRPVSVPDLMATIFLALGLDHNKQNQSNVSRPIRLADPAAYLLRGILA